MVGVTRLELTACHRKSESKFQTRLKTMKKKAFELSTLCGLDVGMIICSPSGRIETLSWPDQQQDDGNILLDLIAKYKNQDAKPNKTRISKKKKETQKSELDVDVRSLRESVMCFDSDIQRVEEKEKQAADESAIIDGDGDDLVSWLNNVMEQPDSPINEDSTTTWPQELPNAEAFSDKSGHSNIPSLMTTGGYPISSQVMIGRAAFQEFNYNTNYNGDQLSYNPYPWRTPY